MADDAYRADGAGLPSQECPMCGGTMSLKTHEDVVQIPGNPKVTKRPVQEWVCPECDYFEEREEGSP
jgi:C4-type Zn-finger protein